MEIIHPDRNAFLYIFPMKIDDFNSENTAHLVETAKNLVALAREVFKLIPSRKERDKAAALLIEMEKKLQFLEAEAAVKLGYQLCLCHKPPEIMLQTGRQFHFKCPKCGSEKDTAPASVALDPPRRPRLTER
jgi:transcription initiation factor IIE alpha subunit